MPLESVSVGEPIKATTMNKLIAHFNGAYVSRAIFTGDGNWTVPAGTNGVKVYLCGGGGGSGQGQAATGSTPEIPGGAGGLSPLVSACFADLEEGATYAIVIGAGGTAGSGGGTGGAGGTSSFGTLLSCTGGGGGPYASYGTASTGTPTGAQLRHVQNLFMPVAGGIWGQGGAGTGINSAPGNAGVVIIEW